MTQELSPVRNIGIQDSTKLPQDKKTNAPETEIQTQPPRVTSRSRQSSAPGALSRLDFRDVRFPELTIHVIDSLGILYPELKDYLLEQAFILGVLQIDLAERDRKKLLDRAFADLRIPSELESKLRRNLAVYGTTENPMKPPPSPYQVNLFDAITALSNLLRYLGVK
ncbi:MAG: hypothetical protein NTU47_17015 [Ignavibacteriales bacterium]|nr:hypothetical protein [Ignavibacteriales bacterium]